MENYKEINKKDLVFHAEAKELQKRKETKKIL